MIVKMRPRERINFLIERDGAKCTFPGCTLRITNRNPLTTDHIIPVSKGGTDTPGNWALMCRIHNSEKADRVWLSYGVLEPRPEKPTKPEKVKKKEPCPRCNEGRNLVKGEICDVCNLGPQPRLPKYLQRTPKECNHSDTHCWACVLNFVARKSALENLLIG